MEKLRILQLHTNFIEYEAVEKEINIAEEPEKKQDRLEEVVVLFTAVENGDDSAVVQKAMQDTKTSLDALKVNKVLIYPYAHLSSNLAKPADALKILQEMRATAKNMGLQTFSSPFGWCKKFSVSIKGHPLAEHLRIVTPESVEETEEAVVEETDLTQYTVGVVDRGCPAPLVGQPVAKADARRGIRQRDAGVDEHRQVGERRPGVGISQHIEVVVGVVPADQHASSTTVESLLPVEVGQHRPRVAEKGAGDAEIADLKA